MIIDGIYDTIIEGNIFREEYGVYYQDDLTDTDEDTDISDDFEETDSPDTNKIKKRVISYIMQ